MAHEVFVSYSSRDKAIADAVVQALEANNLRCWYAPRDIQPGQDWGEAIAGAINESSVFLLIFSGNANRSQRVLDELNLAIAREVVVLPFRIENLDPSGAMMLHLASRHWLDAYDPSWEKHLGRLVDTAARNSGLVPVEPVRLSEQERVGKGIIQRKKLIYGLGAVLTLAALILVFGMDTLFPGSLFPGMANEVAETNTVGAGSMGSDSSQESIESTSGAVAGVEETQAEVIPAVSDEVVSTAAAITPSPDPGTESNPYIWMYVPPALEDFNEVNQAAEGIAEGFHAAFPDLWMKAMPVPDMDSAVDALCDGEAHVVSLDAFSYLSASEQGCGEARMIWSAYSDINYGGMIFVRSDSPVTDILELEGSVLCIPGFNSNSGWVLPSLEIRSEVGDPASFFGEIRELGTHDGVAQAVYDGECDAGTAYYDVRENMDLPDIMDRILILLTTTDVPNNNLSFSSSLTELQVEPLMGFFQEEADMGEDLSFTAGYRDSPGIQNLIEINDYYYNAFRKLFEEAGEDPADYLQSGG